MTLVAARPLKAVIELTRPDGNAGVLMSTAKGLCAKEGLDACDVIAEMASGDYAHLVNVFDMHLGHLFEIRVPPELERQLVPASA